MKAPKLLFHSMMASWVLTLTLLTEVRGISGNARGLEPGIANHAFDHLGNLGEEGLTAAACGANIIYITGIGTLGYSGLPPEPEFARAQAGTRNYVRTTKKAGVKLAIGYLCATSIVGLQKFDANWTAQFRSQFATPPKEWRQQDRHGHPLPSWYGGEYEPACMNNPDWRRYEHAMVRAQLEAGCDGIFFDNPTVHPQGCFCRWCMQKFARAIGRANKDKNSAESEIERTREFAATHSSEFLEFRATTARDFFQEMRAAARKSKRGALVTANNSLNSADALYSQCRSYAYNIYEMSKAEDLVVVEDMSSQPRSFPDSHAVEYAPTYRQLRAISHGKPVVAVTIAEGDYHTAPHLMRLAMAEAVANQASYLSWPTWPVEQRQKMISLIRPESDFLRRNAELFKSARLRHDVVLLLPFNDWLKSNDCGVSRIAAQLTQANIQYEVISVEELESTAVAKLRKQFGDAQLLLANSFSGLTSQARKKLDEVFPRRIARATAEKADWLPSLQKAIEPSIQIGGSPFVRVSLSDQHRRSVVHVLNLNIRRLNSFEDSVTAAREITVSCLVSFASPKVVRWLSPDVDGAAQRLKFTVFGKEKGALVTFRLPELTINGLAVIE